MAKISELPAASSAADTDQLPANQGGATRRVTVAQVRAGLASASHTHAIADVTNLQASLDAKQPIDGDLTALANNSANGLWARTGDGTGAARTITAGTGISVTNGDGVSGNPKVAVSGLTSANVTDFAEAVDDRVAALLVAGSNVTLTYNDAANTLTVAATGGGGGAAAPVIVTASASTTYQATGLTGDRVIKLTATGNVAISAPTFTGLAANSVYLVRYEITASGGARTPSFSGYTLSFGVDPARSIADGSTVAFDTEAHTDGSGAVTLHRLVGVADVGAEPAATLATDDRITFSDTSDGGRPKSAPVSEIRDLPGRALEFTDHVPITGDGTYDIVTDNSIVGTITGITARCSPGSCTANFQIANHTSASDLTPTDAASITGLGAVALTTAWVRATASGANTMGKTGTAGRVLRVVVTGSSGSPTTLSVTVRGTT